ncbi:MAG: type II secretion system protein N [Lysobacterales bacterium]
MLIIAGCIVFGLSLLAHLPARLVFPENSGAFQFIGISGSVWQGEIKQVLFSGKVLPIRNLNWSVNPAALITGTLKADFYEQLTPVNHGTVGLNLLSRQVDLYALHWQFPTNSLDAWIPLSGVKTRGNFVLDLETLKLPANNVYPSQLEGRLDWQNAELEIDSAYWLIGSPVMQFSAEGDVIEGLVTNSQPMLPGESSFQCTIKSCQVELSLQPTPDAPQSVLDGLSLLGLQQTGDKFSGNITFPLE